ncbi:MAG: DUF2817 domain-containing protein [Pseudobdellovibrionaceae bacterium]
MSVTLPEIEQIEKRLEELKGIARVSVLAESKQDQLSFPIYKISFGTDDPKAPVLGLIGGIHGLERIGSQVCVALFQTFTQLVLWDSTMRKNLENFRIFFIPTVNPIGIHKLRRANPRGVDLMRNAPVEAPEKPAFLLGGHRFSSKLPWYRGENEKMELESQALVDAVRAETFQSSRVVTVDFHSGFGVVDRLWFPYAKTTVPFPDLPFMHSFKDLLDRTYPHHFYLLEPQSKSYTTHGDLWDYLYDEYRKVSEVDRIYLPLTLEMGSWMWVKKNPFQIFSSHGPFNPIKHHRFKRVLRRHNTLFEFLIRSLLASAAWSNLTEDQIHKHHERGTKLWYGK